jgi:hypothetical protein
MRGPGGGIPGPHSSRRPEAIPLRIPAGTCRRPTACPVVPRGSRALGDYLTARVPAMHVPFTPQLWTWSARSVGSGLGSARRAAGRATAQSEAKKSEADEAAATGRFLRSDGASAVLGSRRRLRFLAREERRPRVVQALQRLAASGDAAGKRAGVAGLLSLARVDLGRIGACRRRRGGGLCRSRSAPRDQGRRQGETQSAESVRTRAMIHAPSHSVASAPYKSIVAMTARVLRLDFAVDTVAVAVPRHRRRIRGCARGTDRAISGARARVRSPRQREKHREP